MSKINGFEYNRLVKLVRCIEVDLRKFLANPADYRAQYFEDTHYINLVSKKFKDEGRLGARWDDPLLQINWTHARDPILSAQDMAWHLLGDRINDFDGVGNAL